MEVSGSETSQSVPQADLAGLAKIETDFLRAEAIEVSATRRPA